MTALDLLPPIVRADVLAQDQRLREDLLAIPEAEANGWTVTFRDNQWHNSAEFQKGHLCLWWVSGRWRSAWAGRSHKWHDTLADAMKREWD